MTKNKFYLTTAIPYVNAKPHIGHALEFIQGDVVARYHRLIDEDVRFLSGGDENALKNVQAAEAAKKPVKEFVDKNTEIFYDLSKKLNVSFDVWQKGSDDKHYKASQELWKLCEKSGDIYKKSYKGLYCVGCETFYTKNELDENGECFEHPGKKLEEVEEENYFFKLSKYEKFLTDILENGEYEIVPEFRKNEVLKFIKSGLEDFSISRTNERAKNWGVPVPNDPNQRIYVWFDALNIYQSGIGFGWNEKEYKKWWPADLHVIGKGIIRFHAVYWPAILKSAGLALPKKLFVHEYFTVNGQKMSKTIGNVIDPFELIEKYGADALRYYFLAKFSPFQDGDFSEKKFIEVYNADLANGLGNLIARVSKLTEKLTFKSSAKVALNTEYVNDLKSFAFNEVLEDIWNEIRILDRHINKAEPWNIKDQEKFEEVIQYAVNGIRRIGHELLPFLPETAERIEKQFKGPKIKSGEPLFPRI